MVLGAEGDDRAWDSMLARVGEIFSRKQISYGRWHELLGVGRVPEEPVPWGTRETSGQRFIGVSDFSGE